MTMTMNQKKAAAMIAACQEQYPNQAAFLRENDPLRLEEDYFFWLEDGHGTDLLPGEGHTLLLLYEVGD